MEKYDCPQCGEPTEIFNEGVCEFCWKNNQDDLDRHNMGFDWWESLTDEERDREIRRACL